VEVEIGRGKKGRRACGFDDIAIVPSQHFGAGTLDPREVECLLTRVQTQDLDLHMTVAP